MDEEAAQREAELRIQEAEEKAQQKIKEAEQQMAENIVRRLLEKGMEIEIVADSTGLEVRKVIDIQKEIQK